MYRPSILVFVLSALSALLPFASATAASQFHLDINHQASKCFVLCHEEVINSVNLTGKGANSIYWIGSNCKFDEWLTLMPLCFAQQCESPPDVAYAKEYGESLCRRAGVKGVTLEIPQSYLEGVNGTYFSSSAYLASGAGARASLARLGFVAPSVLLATVLGVLLL